MFKCELCGKITKPKEKQYKKIIQTRDKTYKYSDKYGKEQTKFKENAEIKKELNICEECAVKEEN